MPEGVERVEIPVRDSLAGLRTLDRVTPADADQRGGGNGFRQTLKDQEQESQGDSHPKEKEEAASVHRAFEDIHDDVVLSTSAMQILQQSKTTKGTAPSDPAPASPVASEPEKPVQTPVQHINITI
jgi:hypothetical protein